ncbi:MAG: DUF2309 family protein [Gammaproteobacteria bacterium]|nr:DUF2309 family protein [Gammaproteobacteria bacterium]
MLTSQLLQQALKEAKSKLPEQGPLEFFVHHNTLHHYEHLDFFEATKQAAFDYNCNTLMSDEYYLTQYKHRYINKKQLLASIAEHTNKYNIKLPVEIIYNLITYKKYSDITDHKAINAIRSLREANTEQKGFFYKKAIIKDLNIDIDYIISPYLLKFFSHYFDLGFAYWPMANKNHGMLQSFCDLHNTCYLLDEDFIKKLSPIITENRNKNSEQLILHILQQLNINNNDVGLYLFELTYRYKGWSSLIKSLEKHPGWLKKQQITPSFIDYVAIILLCEYAAIKSITKQLPSVPVCRKKYKYALKFITHYYNTLNNLPNLTELLNTAIPYLTDNHRQQILHNAFEQTLYNKFLHAYVKQKTYTRKNKYNYQIICCIDDREESFRRYLELDPMCETFSYPGHFGLNIEFTAYFDKHARSLCPINQAAKFKVAETGYLPRKLKLRSIFIWAELQWLSALSSKTILRGSIQSFIGFISRGIPFIFDIISPKITYRIKYKLAKFLNNSVITKLLYKNTEITDGLDLLARAKVAIDFLTTVDLTKQFSEYIIIMGHGSSSLNNPHEAAYDCGACGGGRGGPNARLMALVLNEPEVRKQLALANILIPENTIFIGAYHNTCSDDIHYYDLNINNDNIIVIKTHIANAAQLNAKERCRRFDDVPFKKLPNYYIKKVQGRSIDLRQPRPEYNHATNAICIIGPREYSRNLFLDRRAFLISYNPKSDPNGAIISNIANTVVPVCAGINLEYLFSFMNNEVYGCGTKLPHNITSLTGVMNGHMSDLQIGLSLQMVEIHQPIRLCILIIADLKNIIKLLDNDSVFSRLVKNNWITLTVNNITNDYLYIYKDKQFRLYLSDADKLIKYKRIDNIILDNASYNQFGYITE